MSDPLILDIDRLREHATAVAGIADDVTQALSSVRGGHLETAAFGLMCSFLVAPTTAMTIAATGMLGAKESMLLRTATQLRETADHWEKVQADMNSVLGDVRKAIDA